MAFDGIAVGALVQSFRETLDDARVYKIAQTEKDELLLTLKTKKDTPYGNTVRLLLSANASLPLALFTAENKTAPAVAPAFCMLLRKHLENGRVQNVSQPSLERVIRFDISHLDEMGDLRTRTLVVELMGKHSNIILTDENNLVLDAIKHVPSSVSSVREVLPGREYFLPDTKSKHDPFQVTDAALFSGVMTDGAENPADIREALYARFKGISPAFATELCFRAGVDADRSPGALSFEDAQALSDALNGAMRDIREGRFTPVLYTKDGRAVDFSALELTHLTAEGCEREVFPDISQLVAAFYARKNAQLRMRNKSADLRALVQTILSRTVRKYDQQLLQLKDTEKRDRFRKRGELLTAYAHEIPAGVKEWKVTDYESGKEVVLPLDEHLSATENAQKCFDRYQRMKRTYETLSVLTKDVAAEIDQLKTVRMAVDLAESEEDLADIRRELAESGFIKGASKAQGARSGRNGSGKGAKGPSKKGGKQSAKGSAPESKPLHYVTSGGFDAFVGKNNLQNDRLTFHAQGADRERDWWFHAKQMPGSHVVLHANGREIPDRDFEEAGALAAWYSTGRENGKVEIDYTQLKNVKKPGGAKPGFVVYYTNYSMVAEADISGLREVP